MKNFVLSLLFVSALALNAQEQAHPGHRDASPDRKAFRRERSSRDFQQRGKPDSAGPRHPLISLLENGDFSPEERVRLKELAEKDPRAFGTEMRRRFLIRRKQEAQATLALRKEVLEAENGEKREQAKKKLRTELEKRAERRLIVHKKILDDTEKNIRVMQARCEKLRKEYEKRVNSKSASVEADMNQILSPEPPQYLLDTANLDPEKPPRRGLEKRSR